jgi:hypothetical protein
VRLGAPIESVVEEVELGSETPAGLFELRQ